MGRKKTTTAPISSSPGPKKPGEELCSNEKAKQASVSENLNRTGTPTRAEILEILPSTLIPKAVLNDAMHKWISFTSQSRKSDKDMGLKFIAHVLLDGQLLNPSFDDDKGTKMQTKYWTNKLFE